VYNDKVSILRCKTVDGHRIEFGFVANLAADNFFCQIFTMKHKYKMKRIVLL